MWCWCTFRGPLVRIKKLKRPWLSGGRPSLSEHGNHSVLNFSTGFQFFFMSQIFSSCSHLIPTGPTGLYLSKMDSASFHHEVPTLKKIPLGGQVACSYMHLAYMYWRTSWTWNQPALAQPAKNFVRPTSARVQNDRQFVWLVPLGIEHLWELSRVFTCVICVMWESRHRTDRRAHCRAKTAP